MCIALYFSVDISCGCLQRSDSFRASNQVVGDESLQVVSRARVRGVHWLSRIDREGFYLGVRIRGRQGAASVSTTIKGLRFSIYRG